MENNRKKILITRLLLGITLLNTTIFSTMFQFRPALVPNNRVVADQMAYQQELDREEQLRANYIDRREKFMPTVRQALTLLTRNIPEYDTQVITLLADIAHDQKDNFTSTEKNNLSWIITRLKNTEFKNRDEAIRLLRHF